MRLRHRVRWADHFTRLVTAASLLLTTTGFTPAPDGGRPPTERRAPEAAPAASTARVYLPYLVSAGSEVAPALADLIPPGVAVVMAEADALGEHATVTAAGAAVLFREQRLAVIAPAGAYPETIALTLRTAPAAATAASAALTFALEARTLAGAAVAHAAQPVRLVVDLRGWPPPAGQAWYLGYQDPQEPALWHRPEVTVHDAAGLISVQTNHFSTWAAGAEPEPWQVSPSLPTAAAFSGAAAYHYPIPAPAGRAGLTPNIDVSYSSRALDALTASDERDQGVLGLGWAVAGDEITRQGVYAAEGERGPVLVYPDLFTLSLGGQSYRLIPAAGADTARAPVVRYFAENGPHLFIERVFDPAAPNQDQLYWLVKTPDGTTHRFGYLADSEAVQSGGDTALAGHAGGPEATALRWLVDTVTDVFGNQLQYDYATWLKRDGGLTTEGVRPAEIRYNFTALAPDPLTRAAGAYASRIAFLTTDDHRLKRLQLFNSDLAQPARTVEFSLDSAVYTGAGNCGQTSATQTVTAIQELGADGVTRRPAVTFAYQALAHSDACFPYLYLRQVDNGYGGRVRFTYAHDGRQEDRYGADRPPAYGRSYFVTRVETWDGLTPQPAVTEYDYARPCYDHGLQLGGLAGAFECIQQIPADVPGHGRHLATGGLVGFGTATLTAYDYGGLRALTRSRTEFSQDRLTVGQPLRAETQGWDGQAWTLRQATVTTYTTAVSAASGAETALVAATALTTFDGGEAVTIRRENARHDVYGNIEEQIEYDFAGQPYRRTVNVYAANTSAGQWLIGALTRQQMFAWDGAGWASLPARETRADYNADGDPATTAPDARGRLTASRVAAGDGRFVDTILTYDVWGHVETSTTYAGYGDETRYASAGPRLTRTDYAAPAALYPLTVTNPLGYAVIFDYDPRLGQLRTITDPNGAVTRYAYDAFGRLTAVARPADTLAVPTTRYAYIEAGAPSRRETYQRVTSGCAACERVVVQIYDGLGRVVQTRAPAEAGQQIVTNTAYDALGRVAAGYVPETQPFSLTLARPAGWERRPHTRTTYDALGRAVHIAGPDGAAAQTFFRGARAAALDANGHQQITETDAFGRLGAVFQYQTPPLAAADFDQPPYAVTRYTYDVRDQLTRVDTLSTTTTLTYTLLGQKSALSDPDLGTWTYTYLPSGELAAQTDARGVITRYTYDALGRPTSKTFEAPAAAGVLNPGPAHYFYDEGGAAAHALGQRTRLSDASGVTTWTYDERGRVTSESRRVAAGLGVYTFGYSYNAADQLLQVTYPDGERVTTALNAAGQPAALTSSFGDTLVQSAAYDAYARLTALTLGNALTTTYHYYAAETPEQGGRLKALTVGGDLLALAYSYDAAGNIRQVHDTSRLMAGGQSLRFEYDALDRLTAAQAAGGAGAYDHAYTYDALGRFTTRLEDDRTTDYAYADPAHAHAATARGAADHYRYDANGAMTWRLEAGVAYTQVWTPEDRLARVTWTTAGRTYTTTFAYDGDGRRVLQLEDDGDTTLTTLYLAGLYEHQVDTTAIDLPRQLYPPDPRSALSPGDFGRRPTPAPGGPTRRSTGLARPARRDYTGPGSRAIAAWVPPVYAWTGVQVSAFTSSCDSKPAAPAPGTECGDPPVYNTLAECADYGSAPCQAGERYSQTGGGYTATTTYDPASAAAALDCVWGDAGWCLTPAALTLSGGEPLPGESILALSYSLNPAGTASHSLSGNPRVLTISDTGPVTYYAWAESSFGDQSAPTSVTVQVDTQLPQILVGGPAPGVWQTTLTAISFSLSDAGSGPRCLRAAWDAWPADDRACSITAGSTLIPAAGAHTLYLRGWDHAGHAVTWSGAYHYDADPPALTGAAATACAAPDTWQGACNAPAFTWPAAVDAVSGLAGYEVYWGADPAGVGASWTASAAYTAGNTAEGPRYLRVRARDQAGNASAWATLFVFRYDATPPTVTPGLSGDAGLAGWYRSAVDVTLTAVDALAGPALVRYRLDGGAWADYAGPFTVAGDGWHTLDYRAQDAAGNWSAPAAQAIHIDAAAPSLTAAAAVEASAVNVLDGVWQNRVADPQFTWAGAADALTGAPARYSVYWGADPAGTAPNFETSTAGFDPAGALPSGVTRYLRVQAHDPAGNASAWRTLFVFRFDNTPPALAHLWPADGQVVTTTLPSLTASASEALPGAGLAAPALTLDQAPVAPEVLASQLAFTPAAALAPGAHTLALTWPDLAGNQTVVRRTFWVDPATQVRITSPAAGAVFNAPETSVIVEGEPGAAVTVTVGAAAFTGVLDAAGWLTFREVALQPGSNSLTAHAVDAAGNTAEHTLSVAMDAGQDAAGVEVERAALNARLAPAVFYATALAGSSRAVLGWALEVRDAAGALAAMVPGAAPAERQAVVWDGTLPAGGWAADGAYTAQLVLTTTGGLVTRSPAMAVALVSAAPAAPALACGPEGETWFSQPPALVRGTAPADTQIVIYQDNVPQFVAPAYALQWQQLISITAGAPYSITVTARALDAAGNLSASSAACRVGLSQTDPFTAPHASLSPAIIGLDAAVLLTATTRGSGAPLTGAGVQVVMPAELGAPTLTRTGQTADAHTWTGMWALPSAGTWQAPVTVVFSATDTAVPVPNQGAQFIQPYVDLVPPALRLTWPWAGYRQTVAALAPQGLAEPFSAVTVAARQLVEGTVVSATAMAGEAGLWRADLVLPDGVYALSAQARDRAGNLGPEAGPITITIDTIGPVLGALVLTPAFTRPGQSVAISMTVQDAFSAVAAVTATVRDLPQLGEAAPVSLQPAGVAYVGALVIAQDAAEGLKPLTFQAADELGNVTVLTGSAVIVDQTPPGLAAPAVSTNGSYLETAGAVAYYGPRTTGTLMLTTTAGDEAGPTFASGLAALRFPAVFGMDEAVLTLAGESAPVTVTHTYTPTGIVSGTFAVLADDRAGNRTQQDFSLRYDATPPTLTVSAPAAAGLRFTVRWAAADQEAGLAGYEAQVRAAGATAWTAWLTDTLETEGLFVGGADQTYTFRVRAADRVGNVSAWQETTVTAAAGVKYYTFGGQRLVMRQGAALAYLHGDHLGSVVLVTDAAGAVLSQARYLPYGQQRLAAGAAPSDFGFTGQRRDDFGLLDYVGRYYSARLAQFVSADPAAPTVLASSGLNRFSYVLNNPLKYIDPTGYTQKLCGEACENRGGASAGAGKSVTNETSYRLTADQYAHLALFAESSNGSHPDMAIYLMSWVAQNSIGNAIEAFDYADKYFYGLQDILKTFLPKEMLGQLDTLTRGTKLYIYKRAYTWYSDYAYHGENGFGDEFEKVTTLYTAAQNDRANGMPDPTNGSLMFNHASYTRYDRTSWPAVGAGGIQNPEHFVAILAANFEKFRAQYSPQFSYSFYIYPSDAPQVGGLVLVTGNKVCIQGWNGCGAYLP